MLAALRCLIWRLYAFVRARRLDHDFAQELESHLALLAEENIRRGMRPEDARRAAAIRLGGRTSLQVQHREARGLPALDAFVQDLRFAVRLLAAHRWFSAAAVATLALGIGANTAGFTIVNAVFLRGLPFQDADRLHVLSWQNRANRRAPVSYPELQDWRSASRSFEDLAGYAEGQVNISDDRSLPEQVNGARVTPNLFTVLRQPPLLGRDFVPADATPASAPVVLISHTLWQSRYFGDRDVLGRTLRIDGLPRIVIGVLPPGVSFPERTDVWTPLLAPDGPGARAARVLRVVGGLRIGVTRREAQAELRALAGRLIAEYPEEMQDFTGVRVETVNERFIGGAARPMFITLMGAATLVLLIACVNVGNMLLARSAHRAREVAVRTAMGATRYRVVRQLVLESVVLSAAGGALGFVLAVWGVRLFELAMQNSGLPWWVRFEFDAMVFGYIAITCLATAIVFGLAPALQVSKANANALLQEGGRSQPGSRRTRWFSNSVVVAQLALATVLLTGAGVLIRSFMTLYMTDLGLPVDRLMTMRVHLPESKYGGAEARLAFFAALEPRVAAVRGVEAVAITTGVPPEDGGERLVETEAWPAGAAQVFVGTVTVTPRYFDVLGVSVRRGRGFDDHDGAPGMATVIVNDLLASRFFPGQNPIGKRLRFTRRDAPPGRSVESWRTVVGVVPLIKQGSALDRYVNSVVYIPYRQETPASASLLLRTRLAPAQVMDAVRRAVRAIDPDQPVLRIQTMAELMAGARWWQRTWGTLFAILAGIALLLSAIGLYAVTACSVSQRTHEIAVRVALGARRGELLWMILRAGVLRLALGLTIGLVAGMALTRAVSRGIMDVSTSHGVTFAAIVTLLSAVSILACLLPGRRATSIDPVAALRIE